MLDAGLYNTSSQYRYLVYHTVVDMICLKRKCFLSLEVCLWRKNKQHNVFFRSFKAEVEGGDLYLMKSKVVISRSNYLMC